MKHTKLVSFILFSLLISCNQKEGLQTKDNANDTLLIYSEFDYHKAKSKKIKIIDTLCLFEENRAKKDIQNKQLTYTYFYAYGIYDYSNKEMNTLLSKYDIKTDSVFKPCAGKPPKGFEWHCYQKLMNAEIEKKFGGNFIDSLRNIADQKFVENNPNFIFNFSECEPTSRYAKAKTYEDFLKKPKEDFIKRLHYTKLNNDQRKKERANTEVFFVIYKDGTVGKIKVESDFSKSKNQDFAHYFEEQAIAFVKNAKWKPAKYRGIAVNSEMYLNLYNK